MNNEFCNFSVEPPDNLLPKKFHKNLKQMEEVTLTAEYDRDFYHGTPVFLTVQQLQELIGQGVVRFPTEDDMKAALKAMEGHSEEIEITFSETQ